jgi:hypothetical protein
MSLLDNLLNRNPTKDWLAQPGLALLLDLDEESFCGIRLGEKADRLQKLGPAEDAAKARLFSYRYTTRGFYCEEEQGRFVEVVLWFAASLEGQAFVGPVRRNGATLVFNPATTEAELVAHLGKPDERESTDAEAEMSGGASLTWHLNRTDCVAEFIDDHLDELWLGTKT